jgi:hypothetical protein
MWNNLGQRDKPLIIWFHHKTVAILYYMTIGKHIPIIIYENRGACDQSFGNYTRSIDYIHEQQKEASQQIQGNLINHVAEAERNILPPERQSVL